MGVMVPIDLIVQHQPVAFSRATQRQQLSWDGAAQDYFPLFEHSLKQHCAGPDPASGCHRIRMHRSRQAKVCG